MSKGVLAIAALVVGLVWGAFVGANLTGPRAEVGISTGLSAGLCSFGRAAEEEGVLSAEDVERIFERAVSDLAGVTGAEQDEPIRVGPAACDQVFEDLRAETAE